VEASHHRQVILFTDDAVVVDAVRDLCDEAVAINPPDPAAETFGSHDSALGCGGREEELCEDAPRRTISAGLASVPPTSRLEFPRFGGHLMAEPFGRLERMSVDAQDPAVFRGLQA
jgi:hypothetical protein